MESGSCPLCAFMLDLWLEMLAVPLTQMLSMCLHSNPESISVNDVRQTPCRQIQCALHFEVSILDPLTVLESRIHRFFFTYRREFGGLCRRFRIEDLHCCRRIEAFPGDTSPASSGSPAVLASSFKMS